MSSQSSGCLNSRSDESEFEYSSVDDSVGSGNRSCGTSMVNVCSLVSPLGCGRVGCLELDHL